MKLKKASAWYYNKSRSSVPISDLGITIRKGAAVDLFKLKPTLSWEQYIRSRDSGVLHSKQNVLVALDGPPVKNPRVNTDRKVSKEPIFSRAKSSYGMDHSKTDYISMIEEEFPPDAVPLNQQDLWELERQKMLEKLEQAEQGDDGEVFDDWLLDDDPTDY